MTLRSSDLQSDSDLDLIRNSCDVFFSCMDNSWRGGQMYIENWANSPWPLIPDLYFWARHLRLGKYQSWHCHATLSVWLCVSDSSCPFETNIFFSRPLKLIYANCPASPRRRVQNSKIKPSHEIDLTIWINSLRLSIEQSTGNLRHVARKLEESRVLQTRTVSESVLQILFNLFNLLSFR